MVIKVRRFFCWDKETQEKLKRLTLKQDKNTQSAIIDLIEKKTELLTFVAFVNGEPVGWAVSGAKLDYDDESPYVMVFIHSEWRRKGIGKRLLELASKHYNPCKVYAWDNISYRFYKNVEKQINTIQVVNHMLDWDYN